MIKTITNRDEYRTNPILTSDAHDYNLTATLFGKEWALYDDFWMLFDRDELAVELPDFIKVRKAEPLKKR